MKTFDELTEKEKERQLCYETSRSRLENIINSDIVTLFIFLAILMTMVFVIFGYGVTTVVTAETDSLFNLGITMLQASILTGIVGTMFFVILFAVIIYKREQFRKQLFAIYEMDENIHNVSRKDLRKIKRTWKKEDN